MRRTRRASCTATSSRGTCWYARTARSCSPTSASPGRRWSASSPWPAPCSAPPRTSRRSRRRVAPPRPCRTCTPWVSSPTSACPAGDRSRGTTLWRSRCGMCGTPRRRCPPTSRRPCARSSSGPWPTIPPQTPTSGSPIRPTSGSPAPAAPAPLSPSSGPPLAPASPGPVSTGPVAPGGTRVMPGGGPVSGGPVSGGPPVSPGGFVRGAAAVPSPPRQVVDTGYTYAGTGPYPVGAPAAAHPTGRRTGLIITAVVLAVLVLLMCVVGGILLLKNRGNGSAGEGGGSPGAGTRTTTGTTAAPAADLVKIECQRLTGRPAPVVTKALTDQGFTVKNVTVDEGGHAGEVVQVPCEAAKGSEVTIKVTTGRGRGGNPSTSTSPGCSDIDRLMGKCGPSTKP